MRVPRLKHLSYANVMSTLAVFIALGGSSYAAYSINGNAIKNRSITGLKLRHNTLTGTQIRESSLATVPRARNAARVGGVTVQDLKVKCPPDTFPVAGVCIEKVARPAAAYGSAVSTCQIAGTPAGPGRRLPTHGELTAAFSVVEPAPGGELTSDVYPSSAVPADVDALYVTDKFGHVGTTPDTAAGSKAYRCVTEPLN
jgi:hypothetical protein